MTRLLVLSGLAFALAGVLPAPAAAQSSNLWITVGPAFASVRGDCQECEEDFEYRKSLSLLANVGRRVNDRMDVGAEVFWVSSEAEEDQRFRTTHIDAVAQFRPWSSKGFFVKGGAGMAFVRNWVDGTGSNPINQKALSVVVGTGWAFRSSERVGYQVFAAQHVAALGDVQTPVGVFENVIGNFWSIGVALVIR